MWIRFKVTFQVFRQKSSPHFEPIFIFLALQSSPVNDLFEKLKDSLY